MSLYHVKNCRCSFCYVTLLVGIFQSLKKMQVQPSGSRAAHNEAEAAQREYKFWKTQPVVQLGTHLAQLAWNALMIF